MKKFISIALASVMLSLSTGCFGEFALVRKVYSWNDSVSSNKFVKTLLFYAMNIIPVYGVASFIDFIILNLIEFWSGSNPISMQEGDIERQVIPIGGEDFMVEATKDQFRIYPLEREGEEVILRFRHEDQSWNMITDNKEEKLISLKENSEGSFYTVYTDQSTFNFNTEKTYSGEFMQGMLCRTPQAVALK